MRWAARSLQTELTPAVLQEACATGHPQWHDKIEWLLGNGCAWDQGTLAIAAAAGRLDVLKLLHSHGLEPAQHCHAAALGGGHIHVCVWLERHGVPLPLDRRAALDKAASGGHLAALRWLVEERGSQQEVTTAGGVALLCAAAAGGDVETISYILEWRRRRAVPTQEALAAMLSEALTAAALQGRFAAVRYLVERQNVPLSEALTAVVAAAPLMEDADGRRREEDTRAGMLRWLRDRGCPFDGRAVVQPLLQGDVAAASVAYEAYPVGAFREAALLALASSGAGLTALRWLFEHGGALQSGTALMAAAARCGSLDTIKWLHELRYALDETVLVQAAAAGSSAMLVWLVEHGCPMGHAGAAYLVPATQPEGPDWATLETLCQLGCPWGTTETFRHIAQRCMRQPWAVQLLVWLASRGCPHEPQDVRIAATELGRQDLVIRIARAAAAQT
ncbi:hypothetical protein GPECTOR_6g621 [Gonium pectorale]|uniref:Ankyrin repeat domain-containing protein n=1 Tax=Gonium pectorale TaxID=33097 RepID=A0A150GV84_GONPE|nr:hypothetical protein GPECTOR_6g621 [Gonium pectorale]|eukprot:KXZ53704.1 hypothetical protein GPECTOR_6g621 [Gonium pectorale]